MGVTRHLVSLARRLRAGLPDVGPWADLASGGLRRGSASGWVRASRSSPGVWAALALLLAPLTAPGHAVAQVPYYVFGPDTEVASLDFEFPSGRTFSVSELKEHMVLSEPGMLPGIRDFFSFLPLVSEPDPHPFGPLDLQRDVARVRRFYQRSGFLETDVRYRVDYREEEDRAAVTLTVDEGRAVTLDSVAYVLQDGGDPLDALPEELHDDWRDFVRGNRDPVGRRYTDAGRRLLVGEVLEWWMNRGWAFARVDASARVDSAAASARLTVEMDPGPRARVGEVVIDGRESVSEELIRRALPFREGDYFSSDALAEGQRHLFGLDLFRLALVSAPEDQPRDSVVRVRVRVQEAPPRLLTGRVGYVSAGGGLTASGDFAHRNLMGEGRTLRAEAEARTGELSLSPFPEREYRLSVSYRRPFTFHPRMTLSVTPFGRFRDNLLDRSWEAGVRSSLIYELTAESFVSLEHAYSARNVLDYRIGSGSSVDLRTLLTLIGGGALDSIGSQVERSTFAVTATLGRFDPTDPRESLQARPVVEVASPPSLNTVEYAMVDVPLLGFQPLGGRFALAARARVGRVFPFGKTLGLISESPLVRQARLRDVLLTAGGTGSVRGWGNGLVGPQFPNLVYTPTGDSLTVSTDGFIPSGGLARASASLELRMPFPGLDEDWGTHVFLDGGRVWTPDARFRLDDPYDETRWFFGTGGGVDLSTPIGPIRLSLGYKLNPSPLDIRHARDLLRALVEGEPLSSVPTSRWRRFHLHVALGSGF